jgi:hypothetical protein
LGRVSFVDWEEEYADPSRKKRRKKGKRETFNIFLFIIGIINKSISLGLSMNHCSPSTALFLAFGFPKVGKSFSFPALNIFRVSGISFFQIGIMLIKK